MVKIDEHFYKLKDKSPKLVKKCFQGVIGNFSNVKSNNFNNDNISNAINISENNKNILVKKLFQNKIVDLL